MAVHGVDHLGGDPQPVGPRTGLPAVPAGNPRPRSPRAWWRRRSASTARARFGSGRLLRRLRLTPPSGRVPRWPHDQDGSHWQVFGPLTRSVLDGAIVFDVIQGPAAMGEAPGPFERAAREASPRLRVAVSEAFPAGTRGTLSEDVRAALRGTAGVLRSLGHDVVERDIDFRVRDNPVIVGLMFRAIRDFVREVEQPQRLERRAGRSPAGRARLGRDPRAAARGRGPPARAPRPALHRA